jgi:hypothetical protein
MVISFKDQSLEEQLRLKSQNQKLSPSLIARRDLQRFSWLLAEQQPIDLTSEEFHAICSIIKAIEWFEQPYQIKRLPALVEDSIRSSTDGNGQYTKVSMWGIDVDHVCNKLQKATPLQLLALLDRAEQYSKEALDQAYINRKRKQ